MCSGETEAAFMLDSTMIFSLNVDKKQEINRILATVYDALRKKGYNPIDQLVGYLISEDPTYITNYNNARSLIRRLDRYELMSVMVESYLGNLQEYSGLKHLSMNDALLTKK